MRKINILFLCLLTVLIISSCNKNEEINPVNNETENNDAITQRNDALEKMALLVTDAVKKEEFRELIKQEATKQFDGDYDILYKRIARRQLKSSNNVSINNFFVKSISKNEQKSAKVAQANLEKMVNTIPDFQISVPVNCDKWDAKNFIPLVTYVPANFDEKTFTKIKAFDQNGNVVWLSLDKAPDVPVIVLGSCERIDENGKLKNYLPPPDGGGGGGSGTGGGTGGGGTTSTGPGYYITAMKMSNISAYEAWILGAPEIRLKVYTLDIYMANANFYNSFYWKPNKRRYIDNKWWDCSDVKACNFSKYPFVNKDAATFVWIEEDGGAVTHIPLTVAYDGVSVGIDVPVDNKDDYIGCVTYGRTDHDCDNYYSFGSFQVMQSWRSN